VSERESVCDKERGREMGFRVQEKSRHCGHWIRGEG
jgi:hypothetical protein